MKKLSNIEKFFEEEQNKIEQNRIIETHYPDAPPVKNKRKLTSINYLDPHRVITRTTIDKPLAEEAMINYADREKTIRNFISSQQERLNQLYL